MQPKPYNPSMRLMREVRYHLTGGPPDDPVLNSWAGGPSTDDLARYLVLRMEVEGEPHPRTGYLCNIQALDELLRAIVIPPLQHVVTDEASSLPRPPQVLLDAGARVGGSLPAGVALRALHLHASPHRRYTWYAQEAAMVQVTQTFEFSAAHRLFCPEYSEAQNREVFGKCANPNGHGHNYLLEVTIQGEPDTQRGSVVPMPAFESIVRTDIIERFDHKHLNLDCPEFGALNPSVENIARVIWDLLVDRFPPKYLAKVRVWETPKTYAEYCGPHASE
jgi:6-pyruvoyltetrahydropterin/6-carboxytetrahydropterin synthase